METEFIDYEDASDFASIYNDILSGGSTLDATSVSPSEAMYIVLNSVLKSLSTHQIKQLAESHGMYCGESGELDAGYVEELINGYISGDLAWKED